MKKTLSLLVISWALGSSLTACSSGSDSGGDSGGESAQTAAQHQETYETLSIFGLMLASFQQELKQKPDPTLELQMRQLGRTYLEGVFGSDVDKVVITDKGLSVK